MEADSLPGINYAEGNSLPFATLNSNPLFNYFLHATKYNNKPSSGKKSLWVGYYFSNNFSREFSTIGIGSLHFIYSSLLERIGIRIVS